MYLFFLLFRKSYSVFLFLPFFFFLSLSVKAQKNLKEDRIFFKQKTVEFNQWLINKKLHQLLRVDSFRIETNHLYLFLGSPYNDTYTNENPDSLSVAWNSSKKVFKKRTNFSLSERLFNTWTFMCETGRDSVSIHIKGKNSFLFSVEIGSKKNQLYCKEKIAAPKREGSITINPLEIKSFRTHTIDSLHCKQFEEVKNSIKECLHNYYQKRGTQILHSADVKIRSGEHELLFEITYVSNEILNDIGFFEYIWIAIKVEQNENKQIRIAYDLQGKYGPGIIFPPRKNNYKNMEKNYLIYLNDYELFLKDKIRNYLTQD